jgi:uncharacterized Tic20 family protein
MTDPNAQLPVNPAAGQPQQPYPVAPVTSAAPLTAAEDNQWAMLSHFGGVVGFLPSLIIFLIFKDRGARTRTESKEALNWQITFTIGYIVLMILIGIINALLFAGGMWGLTGVIGALPLLWWLLNILFSILGGVKVNGGGSYRYPFALRLLK